MSSSKIASRPPRPRSAPGPRGPAGRTHGLQPRLRRRFKATTDSDHDLPVFPNLAADLVPDGPNRLWIADLT